MFIFQCQASIVQFPIPEGKTGPQIIELLSKRVCAIGAVQNGMFGVDCETYTSTSLVHGPQRSIQILHNSEYPVTVFSVLENGSKAICLTTDLLFDLLMRNLSQFYVSKKTTRIESRGPRFEVAGGDFLVKLGTVTMSQKFKGILCEVGLDPAVVIHNPVDRIPALFVARKLLGINERIHAKLFG